jgi:hypothetical protein
MTAMRVEMSLQQAWESVKERAFTPDRGFLISVGDSWTAFFNNHRDEYLAQAELYVLCERLEADTCFFSLDDRGDSIYRGSGHFCYNRFQGGTVQERRVLLYKEDEEEPWIFQQSGAPLPIELTDTYALPDPRDRMSAGLLRTYGQALGIPFWDPNAYGRDVILLRWSTKSTLSDAEVRDILLEIADQPPLLVWPPETPTKRDTPDPPQNP